MFSKCSIIYVVYESTRTNVLMFYFTQLILIIPNSQLISPNVSVIYLFILFIKVKSLFRCLHVFGLIRYQNYFWIQFQFYGDRSKLFKIKLFRYIMKSRIIFASIYFYHVDISFSFIFLFVFSSFSSHFRNGRSSYRENSLIFQQFSRLSR